MGELSRTACRIIKQDADRQEIFGWANVAINKSGEQLVDWQGDVIDPEELEKAAYEHVLEFRETGEKHDPALRSKGRLIESVVFTKEKLDAMGIPEGTVPMGWWVGYKIDDPETWSKIKSGEYRMFSIDGSGRRTPIDDVVSKAVSFDEVIEKYNPFHDRLGRFTTGGSATFMTVMTKDPAKQKWADAAMKREKEKMATSGKGIEDKKVSYGDLDWDAKWDKAIKDAEGKLSEKKMKFLQESKDNPRMVEIRAKRHASDIDDKFTHYRDAKEEAKRKGHDVEGTTGWNIEDSLEILTYREPPYRKEVFDRMKTQIRDDDSDGIRTAYKRLEEAVKLGEWVWEDD